ncbi:MAG: zinc-ribbon domain-containing protein [Terriglobales bacterium]
MYCNNCGAPLPAQQNYCPYCGRAATGVAPPAITGPAAQRLSGHLHLLAIFWFIIAALWAIPAFILFSIGAAAGVVLRGPGSELPRMLGPLVMYIIGAFLLLIALACFIAAWGLLKVRPWARVLALVLGFISLLHPPFGTALGIYTLWVLLPAPAGEEYDRLALQRAAA